MNIELKAGEEIYLRTALGIVWCQSEEMGGEVTVRVSFVGVTRSAQIEVVWEDHPQTPIGLEARSRKDKGLSRG